ncbi:importin-13-like [Ptychodera flava]|uniref:importin-13-like n=1 Tax=Ptychodera flava TaxID=63121 RepID=UPI00396A8C68
MAECSSHIVPTPEITVENIEKAIHQLYYDPNLANKDTAQKWLITAQRAPQAWQYCWILLNPDKPPEVQFFGASALHIRISRSWNELPPEQYGTLRTQLFHHIFLFANKTRIVLTRLCIAMSSFVLNTVPDIWPNAIKDIIDTFQQTSIPDLDDTQKCTSLLELLTVLPEEFHTSAISQARKGYVRNSLQCGLNLVIPFLQSLLTSESPMPIRQQALKCFSSWVTLSIPLTDIEAMIQLLFQLIHNPDMFETCIDALVNIVCNPIAYKFPNCILKIVPLILQLSDMFAKAVQEKDMDKCQGICRLAVAVGENHSKPLLECSSEYKQHVMELTRFILGFSALPGYFPVDENISNIPFGFWYILQDDIISADAEKFNEYRALYFPIYMNLAEVLINKVQYPPDTEYDGWTADEKEEFRCYRQDIADTLMYAYTLLREPLLRNLFNMLQTMVTQGSQSWQMVEACLFAFRSIAEGGEYGDDLCVHNLMAILPQIQLSNVKLASTAMYMLGAYAEWLADTPSSLGSVIPLLLSGLHNSELAVASTMALKDITSECIPHLQPYANDILTTAEVVFKGNSMKSRELIRLMSTIGYTMSSLPVSDTMNYLQLLIGPQVEQLQALANEPPSANSKSGIQMRINMLAMLCATLDYKRQDEVDENTETKKTAPPQDSPPQPVLLILQQVFPILQKIMIQWMSDAGIVEGVCELLKRAQRTLLGDIAPLVPQLSEIMIQIYSVVPQPSILDLAKSLIILFSDNETYQPAVKNIYVQLTTKTLSIFQTIGIQDQTDVIESFMALTAQLLKKYPHIVVTSDCNPLSIYQIGLVSLMLPEPPTVKSTAYFFCEFINQSEKFPVLVQILTEYGRNLLDIVLKAIGGASPRQLMDHMSDILVSLNKHCFLHLCKWLEELLSIPEFPSPRASKAEKEQFKKSILRQRVNKRKIRELVTEFTLICRGLIGTEYADQIQLAQQLGL